MPQINSTFKHLNIKLVKAYAAYHRISFSESVETLTSLAANDWWNKLTKKVREELNERVGVSTQQPSN